MRRTEYYVNDSWKMETYTLTHDEFYYLTQWRDLRKKYRQWSNGLIGFLLGLIQQALFSTATTPIELGILYIGIPSSSICALLFWWLASRLDKAIGILEETIQRETENNAE